MTGAHYFHPNSAAGKNSRRDGGDRDRVWDLVSTYGPDVTRLCRAGPALMSGVAGMGLSAGPAGTVPRIRFFSDTASSQLEAAQLTQDEGPCRDATATRRPVLAADLSAGSWRQRWPRFTPAALDAGVRAVFALPLHAGGVRYDGAVDLYRPTPGPLSSADHLAATIFTAAAAELLTLERHGLSLADAFAHGWRSGQPADAADTTHPGTPTTTPPAPDRVLLACWFGPAMLGPVREQIGVLALHQGLRRADAHRFTLAIHEAVINVVHHGGGHGQLLLWHRDRRLWCEISDHGPGIPTPADTPTDADPGQSGWTGLQIIRRACTSLDISTDPTGTRLLLSHRLDPRPPT
ncbi:ATP-binding protein [Actinoplanes sp. NEAU-A12]|uniref:ATP-binding protein n=1 Tax=Actinoplanes sandaracinus TaxID=3045177 RepID=A0ABT6WX79_9ACTN|nr:ATP-binding protein [Actinoplanes sandaracinus]MDI6104339.1 ATP-binding protein [Actinoplanes sandaracinus]